MTNANAWMLICGLALCWPSPLALALAVYLARNVDIRVTPRRRGVAPETFAHSFDEDEE